MKKQAILFAFSMVVLSLIVTSSIACTSNTDVYAQNELEESREITNKVTYLAIGDDAKIFRLDLRNPQFLIEMEDGAFMSLEDDKESSALKYWQIYNRNKDLGTKLLFMDSGVRVLEEAGSKKMSDEFLVIGLQ